MLYIHASAEFIEMMVVKYCIQFTLLTNNKQLIFCIFTASYEKFDTHAYYFYILDSPMYIL